MIEYKFDLLGGQYSHNIIFPYLRYEYASDSINFDYFTAVLQKKKRKSDAYRFP